jgi:hypothetical protein
MRSKSWSSVKAVLATVVESTIAAKGARIVPPFSPAVRDF